MIRPRTVDTGDLLARLEVLERRIRRLRASLLLLLVLGAPAVLLGFSSVQDRPLQTQRLVLLDRSGAATGELMADEGKLLMRLIPRARDARVPSGAEAVAGIMLSRENGFVVVGETGRVLARLGGDPWRWLPSE